MHREDWHVFGAALARLLGALLVVGAGLAAWFWLLLHVVLPRLT